MKTIKYWLPKIAVVVVGVIIAMFALPYVNAGVAKLKNIKQGA